MLILKQILADIGSTQSDLAKHLGISPAGVAQICNHGIFPKKPDGKAVRYGILKFLERHGTSLEVCRRAFDEVPEGQQQQPQEEPMLLRKQSLTPAAKKHFALFRDPFAEGVESDDDLFMSPDIYYVLDTMMGTAQRGGFVAVVGESGAGKTTLVEEMEERFKAEPEVMIIKPFVIGMEGGDSEGRRLKAASILDSILRRVAPDRPRRSLSLEDKSNAAYEALLASRKANNKNRHCLVIEEAHRLAAPTLRHLKGFYEMKQGRTPLLSIILVGQTELDQRLNPANRNLREVTQRCEVIRLQPLDNHLEAFIKFKFERAGKAVGDVIDASGIDQIRARLTSLEKNTRGQVTRSESLLYPLAVSNLMTEAMNMAAQVGIPRVNGDIVKGV